MKVLSRRLLHLAHAIAKDIQAKAVEVCADAVEGDETLRQVMKDNYFCRSRPITFAGVPSRRRL